MTPLATETDLQGKIAFVFVSLILALTGLCSDALGAKRRMAQGSRSGSLSAFPTGLSFASPCLWAVPAPSRPSSTAWATNVILGVVAFVMYRRVNT